MNTQELHKKFHLVQITLFKTKTPLTYWFDGGKEENLDRILEVIDGKENNDFDIWDSFYNNTWRTFIRLYPETKLKEDCSAYEEYDEDYYDEGFFDGGLEETMREAYEYHGPKEGFHDWLDANGY